MNSEVLFHILNLSAMQVKQQMAATKRRCEELRKKLQQRKDRHKKRQLKDLTNMSAEEQAECQATQADLAKADRQREENELMAALKALEEVGNANFTPKCCEMLNDSSRENESSRDRHREEMKRCSDL